MFSTPEACHAGDVGHEDVMRGGSVDVVGPATEHEGVVGVDREAVAE